MSANSGPRALSRLLPREPGVYRFRDAHDDVLYVGRAVELRRRVASYGNGLRDRGHLRDMVAGIQRVEAVVCASPHEAAWLERNVLERRMPYWNRTAGGQENPVYIRLDAGADRPGLSVVHVAEAADRIRHFGPYLGGLKVRLAAAALHRVLPLAYAGSSSITASERELAATLGVGANDREEIVAAVAAILDRRATAVAAAQADLRRRRDHAAGTLAFELAARIQEEMQALEWVTSVQRVTRERDRNVDAYGWADGVLVHFEIRRGRLIDWTQRRCTGDAAIERVRSTPVEWRRFAATNATLAARLAG